MRLAAPLAAALLATLLSAGCDKARPYPAAPAGQTGCTGCHGGFDNTSGAPPRGLHGELDNAGPFTQPGQNPLAVGAHSPHLAAGVGCEECHKVPTRVGQPGHLVGPAGAAASRPARRGGHAPWPGGARRRRAQVDPVARFRPPRPAATSTATAPPGAQGGRPRRPDRQPARPDLRRLPRLPARQPRRHRCLHLRLLPPPDGDRRHSARHHPRRRPHRRPGRGGLPGRLHRLPRRRPPHGDVPLNAAAPPLDLGRQASSDQVGAHRATCTAARSPGRSPAPSATWSPHQRPRRRATQGGVRDRAGTLAPTAARHRLDHRRLTCNGIYCHGATLGGGSNP